MTSASKWTCTPAEISGLTGPISHLIAACHRRHALPDLRSADPLTVFSDYGGEHLKHSGFETYGFLICNRSKSEEGLLFIQSVQENMLDGGRRSFDFKNIRGGLLNVIAPFWTEVRKLHGLALVIGIDLAIGSLVRDREPPPGVDVDHELLSRVSGLAKGTKEDLHCILHFMAMLLCGVIGENQKVEWIMDRGSLTEQASIPILGESTRNLFQQYALKLGSLNIWRDSDRTASDGWVRPLMWVPDQLAGALSEMLSQPATAERRRESGLIVTGSAALQDKSQLILQEAAMGSATFRSIGVAVTQRSKRMGVHIEWDSAMKM